MHKLKSQSKYTNTEINEEKSTDELKHRKHVYLKINKYLTKKFEIDTAS